VSTAATRRGEGAGAAQPPTGQDPTSARWTAFVFQDGIILCATLRAFSQLGILEPSLRGERCLADLLPGLTRAGFGYLRVGLRTLAAQGWLADSPTLDARTTDLRWTDAGRRAAGYRDRYMAAGRFLAEFSSTDADAWSRPWDGRKDQAFLDLLPLACDRWGLGADLPPLTRALVTTHLDSGLIVPVMLWLREAGRLGENRPVLPEGEVGQGMNRLLVAVGWLDIELGTWTAKGRVGAVFSIHFGMAASYLPLLARLPQLYRDGTPVAADPVAREWHVHRGLNVSASAAAHTRYFADADAIFSELFDREPVEAQPRFVADMGCGDGSWLVRLHRLITERTRRGQQPGDAPLMVGLDYSAAALEQARRVLEAAGVPALLLPGDVSDPDQVRATLAEHGLAMDDGLHVRAFIDHNRRYLGTGPEVPVRGWSSGAYIDAAGEPLSAAAIEREMVAHLQRWTPHVGKHGLVMLEAHCVDSRIVRRHLGATHAVAFDAYHGYSQQYPLEHSAFVHCCQQAGLRLASYCERRYPATRPFVAVSLNRLLVAERASTLPSSGSDDVREDTWRPDPATSLEDGRALHRLLYQGGDLRYPRLWCSAPTGFVVARALEVVEQRLATAGRGSVIRVMDYGAGTGLATIEFLKACDERGLERRLERRGVTLEVHLVDLPSSWFAQGFELLRDCAWTRFHSLRAANGGFRPLSEVMGGETVDIVMANMVFHLVPPQALERMAEELGGVTDGAGRLVWSSPDLGPPGPYAVLFHDANRALRKRCLQLLADGRLPGQGARPHGQRRADRRVRHHPNAADDVVGALTEHFLGEAELKLETHEILEEDILDTLLVPSNQREYLSEIADRRLREKVIRDLMAEEVLPTMRQGPAGTAVGLNVQWTLGSLQRR